MLQILVAGLDMADNQYTRFVQGCGMEPVHMSERSASKPIPLLDGAIVCLGNTSHELQRMVQELYRGADKPYFSSHSGVSNFKEKFIQTFFGNQMDLIEELPDVQKMAYIISRHFNRGSTFSISELIKIVTEYYMTEEDRNFVDRLVAQLKHTGMLENTDRGKWRFMGITPRFRHVMSLKNVIISEDLVIDPPAPTKLEKVAQQPQPPLPTPHTLDLSKVENDLLLTLDATIALEKKIELVAQQLGESEERLVRRISLEVQAQFQQKQQMNDLEKILTNCPENKRNTAIQMLKLFLGVEG